MKAALDSHASVWFCIAVAKKLAFVDYLEPLFSLPFLSSIPGERRVLGFLKLFSHNPFQLPCHASPGLFHKHRVVWSSMLFSEPQMVLITGPLKTVLCQLLLLPISPSFVWGQGCSGREHPHCAFLCAYECSWIGEKLQFQLLVLQIGLSVDVLQEFQVKRGPFQHACTFIKNYRRSSLPTKTVKCPLNSFWTGKKATPFLYLPPFPLLASVPPSLFLLPCTDKRNMALPEACR